MSSPWRDGRVPGQVELAYGRTGDGPDPVLALHGITAHHRVFGEVARRLRHPGGMVGLDLRGRGHSGKPPRGSYGLDAHAQDVIRVLDHVGVERAVVAGHSMGAFVATRVALRWPDRVRALALLDGGWARRRLPRPSLNPAVWAGMHRALHRLERTFESADAYVQYWMPGTGATLRGLPPEVAEAYTYGLQEVPGGVRARAARRAADEDALSVFRDSATLEQLARLWCPVVLARPGAGFVPGAAPLFSHASRDAMAGVVDLRADLFLPRADHYSMLTGDHAGSIAALIDWLCTVDSTHA